MTRAQIAYFCDQLPEVEYRRAYPIADLTATILNMMGGKRKKDDDGTGEPPLEPHELFSALEFLPPFGRPAWVEDVIPRISADAARDFMRHRRQMPDWVLQIAPIEMIARAAEQD